MEKIVSLTEEKEKMEEEIEVDDGSEEEEDNEEEEAAAAAVPQASDETEKKNTLPAQPKEKKEADVLNLNNEVVKMRKEVKRVRALIIRKLTRQIGALKKKKGKDAEIERNQRRAARLLEEIHSLKILLPDLVTKTALQKNLNFEQVCKNPKSSISDRAIARIATHPQFNKKIEDIKAAVKAFKEERMKSGKQGGKEKIQNQAVQADSQSPDRRVGRKTEREEEKNTVEQKEGTDNEKGGNIPEGIKAETAAKPERQTGKVADCADSAGVEKKDTPEAKSIKPVSQRRSDVKTDRKKEPNLKPTPAALQKMKDEEESDLELSDGEEKEYFDDSTEERFHKQSSQSEESDDNDDFFVGKVSKFKKKKKKQETVAGEDNIATKHEVKKDSTYQVQRELEELEARLKSKATSLQSVFCSSLSGLKHSHGGSTGRGRSGEKFRSQGKTRDFNKQSKFQNQDKGAERTPCLEGRHPKLEEKGFASVGRGRGRGRGDVLKHKDHRGARMAAQQALHPSWEASKKRKEQQGQILAFQGKKIKFDDDDD